MRNFMCPTTSWSAKVLGLPYDKLRCMLITWQAGNVTEVQVWVLAGQGAGPRVGCAGVVNVHPHAPAWVHLHTHARKTLESGGMSLRLYSLSDHRGKGFRKQ